MFVYTPSSPDVEQKNFIYTYKPYELVICFYMNPQQLCSHEPEDCNTSDKLTSHNLIRAATRRSDSCSCCRTFGQRCAFRRWCSTGADPCERLRCCHGLGTLDSFGFYQHRYHSTCIEREWLMTEYLSKSALSFASAEQWDPPLSNDAISPE